MGERIGFDLLEEKNIKKILGKRALRNLYLSDDDFDALGDDSDLHLLLLKTYNRVMNTNWSWED